MQESILVVEDSAIIGRVICFGMNQAGFRTKFCRNGVVAVEALATEQFDVIISDYQMPGMNGEDVFRHARQDPRHSDVPIILVTGKEYEIDVNRLTTEYSLAAIFSKPFSPTQLVATVKQALLDRVSA